MCFSSRFPITVKASRRLDVCTVLILTSASARGFVVVFVDLEVIHSLVVEFLKVKSGEIIVAVFVVTLALLKEKY